MPLFEESGIEGMDEGAIRAELDGLYGQIASLLKANSQIIARLTLALQNKRDELFLEAQTRLGLLSQDHKTNVRTLTSLWGPVTNELDLVDELRMPDLLLNEDELRGHLAVTRHLLEQATSAKLALRCCTKLNRYVRQAYLLTRVPAQPVSA